MRDEIDWRRAAGAAAVSAGLALLAAPASAEEVKLPRTAPEVALRAPDGWAVAYSDLGVELRSPEKDSVVVAGLVAHDMVAVDVWKAKVLERLKADGVSVDKAAASGAGKASPPPAAPAQKAGADKPISAPPTDALPGTAATPSFAFAGGPSLGTPSLGADSSLAAATPSISGPGVADRQPAMMAAPSKHHKEEPRINGLRIQSYRLLGGRFKDKPTDIQLVLYTISKTRFLAVEQQSSPEDNRAAAVLTSVQATKGAQP